MLLFKTGININLLFNCEVHHFLFYFSFLEKYSLFLKKHQFNLILSISCVPTDISCFSSLPFHLVSLLDFISAPGAVHS